MSKKHCGTAISKQKSFCNAYWLLLLYIMFFPLSFFRAFVVIFLKPRFSPPTWLPFFPPLFFPAGRAFHQSERRTKEEGKEEERAQKTHSRKEKRESGKEDSTAD